MDGRHSHNLLNYISHHNGKTLKAKCLGGMIYTFKSVSQNFTRIFRKKAVGGHTSTELLSLQQHMEKQCMILPTFLFSFFKNVYEEKNILAISTNLLQLIPHVIEWPCPFPIIRIHVMDEYDKQSASVECQNGGHIKNGSRVSLFVDGLQFRPIVWSHMKMQWT